MGRSAYGGNDCYADYDGSRAVWIHWRHRRKSGAHKSLVLAANSALRLHLQVGSVLTVTLIQQLRLLNANGLGAMPSQTPNSYFADALNEAFSTQKSIEHQPPLKFSYYNSSIGTDQVANFDPGTVGQSFFTPSGGTWMTWLSGDQGIDLYAGGPGYPGIHEYNSAIPLATPWCSDVLAKDTGTNNGFVRCLNYAGSGSTSNYMSFRPLNGTDVVRLLASGVVQLPNLISQSCLGTDASGNIGAGTCGGATTNALTAAATGGAAPGTTFNGSAAVTLDYHSFGSAGLAASNTFSGATTNDFSGTSQLKLPVAAGYASLANGEIGYDSTNNNFHAWVNGADLFLVPLASGFTSGHCGQPALTGNTWTIQDAGGACGVSGGGAAFSAITSGTNTTATMTVGTGGSIARSGIGSIDASAVGGITVTGTPAVGDILTVRAVAQRLGRLASGLASLVLVTA